eukprot:NODE_7858_length_253_cov_112.946078_g7243_i0.p2 GENE.NODE_7858_length_253_cov_112.946078_g7243_i0~~NODE_7858_length_253_cov_112.946078_g7243_i0.p2  ORF type:complete len:52 (+),score=14.34 NODE_7858_length_253_cov_112.946078_g7243_i0:24-158(+)
MGGRESGFPKNRSSQMELQSHVFFTFSWYFHVNERSPHGGGDSV